MIYAIEAVGTGFIKFGKAKSVGKRLKELEVGNPFELSILAVADWPDSAETAIHKYLEPLAERGEWFRDGALSREVVGWIAANDIQPLNEAVTRETEEFDIRILQRLEAKRKARSNIIKHNKAQRIDGIDEQPAPVFSHAPARGLDEIDPAVVGLMRGWVECQDSATRSWLNAAVESSHCSDVSKA